MNRITDYPEEIRIAFFDLDETMTAVDTDFLWARWRLKNSLRGVADLLRLINISRLYYSHRLTEEKYARYHLSRAGTMTPGEYRETARRFVREAGRKHVYPPMRDTLQMGREKGIRNVMITAQDEVIAAAFAEALGFDACIASSYRIENGRFADMDRPLVFRDGKVVRAGNYLAGEGFGFDECAFFTDSRNDLPLLEKCRFPVVVNPVGELRSLAGRKGWPVLTPSLEK